MCMWFSNEELPIAFGFLLFLVKMARAVNDNVASVIYNYYNDLLEFFSIGLYVCIFSFLSSLVLTHIHQKALDKKILKQNSSPNVKQKLNVGKTENKAIELPVEANILAIVVSVGYAAIQSFYPNMSKFMQQNYGLTNSHAGMLSSIPYIVASVLVPI